MVRNLHSGNWKDREAGLSTMTRQLQSDKFMTGQDAGRLHTITCDVLAKSLK